MNVDWSQVEREVQRSALRLFELQTVTTGAFLKQQGRLFVIDAAKLTPPLAGRRAGASVFDQTWNVQRKRGESAIVSRLNKLFRSVDSIADGWDQSRKDTKAVRRYARAGNVTAVAEIFYDLERKEKVIARASYTMFSQIWSWQTDRPRVQTRFAVCDAQSLKRTIADARAHVGTAKSGWVTAANALGYSFPNWISRHHAPGIYVDNSQATNAFLTIGNLVSYGSSFAENRIIAKALEVRAYNMEKLADRIVAANLKKAEHG